MFKYDSNEAGVRTAPNIFQSGVFHENRDSRAAQDVVMPFTARINNRTYNGRMFSLERIVLDGTALEEQSGAVVHKLFEGDVRSPQVLQMRLLMSGYVFEFVADVHLISDPQKSEVLAYQIVDMNPTARKSLQRVVRSFFSGRIPDADVLINSKDEETPNGGTAARNVKRKPIIAQTLTIMTSCIVLILVCAISIVAIYNRISVVESTFATVTAPQTLIRSPEPGRVSAINLGLNQAVVRDEKLFEIQSSQVESELELAKTRLGYALEFRANGQTPMAGKIEALNSGFKNISISSDSTNVLIGTIDHEIQLETGHLRALELRKAALGSYAPCDCVVAWAETNGTWVQGGDPVAILVHNGANDMRVEALVNLSHVGRLDVGQDAYVKTPNGQSFISATIERISVGTVREPRFGFPDSLKKQPSQASVIIRYSEELPIEWISAPLEVYFTKPIGFDFPQRFANWIMHLFGDVDVVQT